MRIAPPNCSAALLRATLCGTLALAPASLLAQRAPAPVHAPASGVAHPAGGGCIKLPDVSPKIPALPAGSPCPKALFTLTTTPDVRVEYAAPSEGDIAKTLGLDTASFSLAYVDTRVGTGALAVPHKYITVKYTGYLTDGTVFDASDKHPETAAGLTFELGGHQVVVGWDTGFAGMRIGGKRRLYIPFQLAYGPNGRPPTIPARSELIFDMELVGQSDTAPAPKAPPAAPAASRPATPPGSNPLGGTGSGSGSGSSAPSQPTAPATPPPGNAPSAPASSTPTAPATPSTPPAQQ